MTQPLPFYVRTALVLLILWLLLYGVYIGQSILLPLGFSFLFAVLLRPVEKKLLAWKIPRVPAIILTLLGAIAVLAGLAILVSSQTASLVGDIPSMKTHLLQLWTKCQLFLERTFHVNRRQQELWLDKARADTMDDLGGMLSRIVSTLTMSIADLFLVPIYIFFFLYYRDLLTRFVTYSFHTKHASKVAEITVEVRSVIQHYITGIMTETASVAVLNVVGLLIFGVPFAVVLGVIGAIINMIPYIGGAIAVALTVLVAYADTGSVTRLFEVWAVQAAVQFIDNHLLVPYLIGSRVKLNALVSLVAIFIGFALCGIGGMFLVLPALAICKVIFDRVDELRPWGLLLGDDTETRTPFPRNPRIKKFHRLR
jgi:predicted PurR-regulated permease PerM